ncbi:hypothetical protein HPB50_004995 [Hyalomma asiaticum]|uniref:Uncharacterized protein n=1 Tax=Hyalomma asiaticum TaxID=266040 RepID=A0ACB7RHE3_HYAAI|nr:hypothetical protein HPB50_004995 [Hyalomma asiaticum]
MNQKAGTNLSSIRRALPGAVFARFECDRQHGVTAQLSRWHRKGTRLRGCRRLAARLESIDLKFKACGLDLDRPCCKAADIGNRCWITRHLPTLNQAMSIGLMHMFEHAPGKFTLRSFSDTRRDYRKPESSCLESVTTVYWLLNDHQCVTRLDLREGAVLFCYFAALLSKALRANKGLEHVHFHPRDMSLDWVRTCPVAILSFTMGMTPPEHDLFEIDPSAPSVTSFGGIAEAVRKGRLRRLTISDGWSAKMVRKVFRAVGFSSSLSALEVCGDYHLPVSSAAILSEALKRNKTLRTLSIGSLVNDGVGILLQSLNNNSALEELSVTESVVEPSPILWDGFEALRANRTLKSLTLKRTNLSIRCALVIAGILRDNNALEQVCLSGNFISDHAARALAEALQFNSTLKRLDISMCHVSYEALSSFVKSLSINTTVKCVRVGAMGVWESWTPSSPLTADICARLGVTWNTRGLEDWAKSLRQGGHDFCQLSVGWTVDAKSSAIIEWFDAVCATDVSITELEINCPYGVVPKCQKAVLSFLASTCSLKKLTVNLGGRTYCAANAIIRGLSHNKSVSEAKFCGCYFTVSKALEDLMRMNRTLHFLTFESLSLSEQAVRSLARALEDNFVLLKFDLEYRCSFSMHLIRSILDRNHGVLCRAVECVLNSSAKDESIRALRLLSATDSLLSAVAEVSGEELDECRRLVQEAVSRRL